MISHAHGRGALGLHGGLSAGCSALKVVATSLGGVQPPEDVAGWIQSLAVCRNSDLVASGELAATLASGAYSICSLMVPPSI